MFQQVIGLLYHRGLLVEKNELLINNISVFARKQSNLKHPDFGMKFDMRPSDRNGTACITVRTTRLVKHPDSLWETSVVYSGSVAKAFPTTQRFVSAGSSLSHPLFFSRLSKEFLLLCPSSPHLTNKIKCMKFSSDEYLFDPEMKCQK